MQRVENLEEARNFQEYGSRGIPLIMLSEGEEGVVSEIHCGRGLRRRLAEMGFSLGERVRMIRNHSPGPVMVEVRDSRVSLGRGVSMKVVVYA
ncbi:MAG: ferrous iron transport protein A [Candidatus Bathyarchaeia archaeon]